MNMFIYNIRHRRRFVNSKMDRIVGKHILLLKNRYIYDIITSYTERKTENRYKTADIGAALRVCILQIIKKAG